MSLFAPVYMQMELNKAWRAIGDSATSHPTGLPAAPATDFQPPSVEADQGAFAQPPLSDSSDEVERPPRATPAQEDDAQ